MPITALPTPPTRQDPANFSARADDFLGALPTFATEANALQAEVNSKQAIATSAAVTAVASAEVASAAANYKGEWSALIGPLNIPASVLYNNVTYMLKENVANVALEVPGISTKWISLSAEKPGVRDSIVKYKSQTNLTTAINTASGFTSKHQIIDDTRDLILMSDANSLQAVVFDKTTETFGNVVLIRLANSQGSFQSIFVETGKILIASTPPASTASEFVVLTITGKVISVGTPTSVTLAGSLGSGACKLIKVGTSFVWTYRRTTDTSALRAITITGTTVSVGLEFALTGTTALPAAIYPTTSSSLVAIYATSTALIATPISISGLTLTAGTSASTAATAATNYSYLTTDKLNTGRFAAIYTNTEVYGAIISVSGMVATISTTRLYGGSLIYNLINTIGNQIIVYGNNRANVLTDSGGVALAGTEATLTDTSSGVIVGSEILIYTSGAPGFIISISGNNPVVSFRSNDTSAASSVTYAAQYSTHLGEYTSSSSVGLLTKNGLSTCVTAPQTLSHALSPSQGDFLTITRPWRTTTYIAGYEYSYVLNFITGTNFLTIAKATL